MFSLLPRKSLVAIVRNGKRSFFMPKTLKQGAPFELITPDNSLLKQWTITSDSRIMGGSSCNIELLKEEDSNGSEVSFFRFNGHLEKVLTATTPIIPHLPVYATFVSVNADLKQKLNVSSCIGMKVIVRSNKKINTTISFRTKPADDVFYLQHEIPVDGTNEWKEYFFLNEKMTYVTSTGQPTRFSPSMEEIVLESTGFVFSDMKPKPGQWSQDFVIDIQSIKMMHLSDLDVATQVFVHYHYGKKN